MRVGKTLLLTVFSISAFGCSNPTEPINQTVTTIGDSIKIVTPLPTFPSSYENFKAYVLPPLLSNNSIVPSCERNGYRHPTSNGRGYADFLQNGTITLVDAVIGPPMGSHTDPSIICFWKRNNSGQWIDITETFMTDNHGCVGGANKSLIADFNRDGRPDIFFLCTGPKWNADGSVLTHQPGGISFWLVSQPDGKYRTQHMNYSAYAHGGSAGDINSDGYPDVVFSNGGVIVVNGQRQEQYLTVLLNDKNGGFLRRDDIITIPDSLRHQSINAVELIDVDDDGLLDILVANGDYRTFILWGDKNGTFPNTRPPTRLPFSQPESNYNGTHNFHKIGRFLYAWNVTKPNNSNETGNSLERISIDTWQVETIWRRTELYKIEGWGSVDSWGQIRLYGGKFIHDFVLGLTIDP